ncbi:MAG: DUF2357 domain-containing protein [Defluviitaleaceae bacterium]|nr:DUF2357 domain-containing protein [Defluviitaleaceae bacterium]
MNTYLLTLLPHTKSPILVNLYPSTGERLPPSEGLHFSENLYADLAYDARLQCKDLDSIQNVRFYVNDELKECNFFKGEISFPNNEHRIFFETYGFLDITIVVEYNNGPELRLRSNYISVLVKPGTLNDNVRAMTNYVYQNQDKFLLVGDSRHRKTTTQEKSDDKGLDGRIELAEEIAINYENSFSYFKANSRFKIEEKSTVERIEKLRYITPRTLQYTVQHPEHLRPAMASGISYMGRYYHPERTLSAYQVYSTDIYENENILRFIRTILMQVQEIKQNVSTLVESLPKNEDFDGEYIFSPYYVFGMAKEHLEVSLMRIDSLIHKFSQMWGMYRNLFNQIPLERLGLINAPPRATAIFLGVPQYNRIFVQICHWFDMGFYNLGKESFMLNFIKLSSLYETYALAKLINFFRHKYTLKDTLKCEYPIFENWRYKNIDIYNTFVFEGKNKTITLYYQPVIYDRDYSKINGVGLYRNNSISFSNSEDIDYKGNYYVPDFLVKIEENKRNAQYIICDAKFSSLRTIKNHYISALTYKYLFSLSTTKATDTILGLCIIYGQAQADDAPSTIYDKQSPFHQIYPFAELLPLAEGTLKEKHFEFMHDIFTADREKTQQL